MSSSKHATGGRSPFEVRGSFLFSFSLLAAASGCAAPTGSEPGGPLPDEEFAEASDGANATGSGGSPGSATGGSASGGASDGGAGSVGSGGTTMIPVCGDEYPFADGYTCAQQAAWGKCDEAWMADACDATCGRCSPSVGGTGGAGGTHGGSTECGISPADPSASGRTKELLCYLKTSKYISGQTDVADAVDVETMTGRYPAMVAFDFYRYTDGDTSETQKAIEWHQQKKGIVAFQWHWKSPGGGEFYTDYSFENALDDSNSKLYADIDLVARELKKMGDAGVVVLYRPLHESNNNFMWWAKRGPDAYKRLFRLIYERTVAAGAHDLIWVYNGMASGQSRPLSDFYPGDDVVDVISSDYFQSWSDYDTMASIGAAKNKVLSIAETFHALDPASDPPFSYSVVWASRDWGSQGVEDSWRKAMSNSATLAIDTLPAGRNF